MAVLLALWLTVSASHSEQGLSVPARQWLFGHWIIPILPDTKQDTQDDDTTK